MKNTQLARGFLPFAFFSALLLSISVPGVSQQKPQPLPPPTTQEPPSVLKVTTRLVTVDVVARDRKGNPVKDLKPEDFQITEQANSRKSQQTIATFRLLDRAMAQAPDAQRAAYQLPSRVYTNLVTTKDLSAPPTILLVDGLNTDASTQLQVKQKMVKLLASMRERCLFLDLP